MIIKVTHLLRNLLDQRGKHLIAFEEELAYFERYLDIEQERFHDRLTVNFDIEEATKPVLVPTLMLQPLIENAFKHGISLIEEKAQIKLSASIKDQKLAIKLSNSIPKDGRQNIFSEAIIPLEQLPYWQNTVPRTYSTNDIGQVCYHLRLRVQFQDS